jgi:hypothetical protein
MIKAWHSWFAFNNNNNLLSLLILACWRFSRKKNTLVCLVFSLKYIEVALDNKVENFELIFFLICVILRFYNTISFRIVKLSIIIFHDTFVIKPRWLICSADKKLPSFGRCFLLVCKLRPRLFDLITLFTRSNLISNSGFLIWKIGNFHVFKWLSLNFDLFNQKLHEKKWKHLLQFFVLIYNKKIISFIKWYQFK